MNSYLAKIADRQEIKRKAIKKNLRERIEKARYECYKEIQALGGPYENLGDKQEMELIDFVSKLSILNLPYYFLRELENEIKAFINQLERLDDNDLPEINRFIKGYERRMLKVA